MAVGVDVHCYYQRGIRWDQVSGVNYVWVKVSDGTAPYTKVVSGVTYRPDTMVQGAKSRNLPVGGYHFAQPGDPRAQADLLIREVERLGATGLLPALDIEDPFPIGQARAFGEAFCNRIREHGYRPVVYTGDAYAATIKPADWAAQPVLWIARYGSKPKNTRFDVHQFSSSGSLPGSASAVDFNESYNDSFLNTSQASPTPTPSDNPPTSTTGVELMERISLTQSSDTTSKRIYLPGGPNCRLIVRPPEEGGQDFPVYIQNVYAWGDSPKRDVKVGIGFNPMTTPGYDFKITYSRVVLLPYAIWCDFEYSCNADFVVDVLG